MSSLKGPRCQRHPENMAEEKCVICHGVFCRFCTVPSGQRAYHGCPVCPSKTVMTPIKAGVEAGDFVSELTGVFGYPIRNNGWVMVLLGALTGGVIISILLFGGMLMIFTAFPIALAVAGFLWMFLQEVVVATAEGKDELPDWPDYSGVGPAIKQILALCLLLMICSIPVVVLWLLGVKSMAALLIALGIGLTYFPMGMLALAMGGYTQLISPLIVIPSILRIGSGYAIAVAALIGVMFVRVITERVLGGDSLLSQFIVGTLGFYFLIVQARVVGLLYRTYQHELGWFDVEEF